MMPLRRFLALLAVLMLLMPSALGEEEEVIQPQWEVPDYVTWLLQVADGEVGYTEGAHGYSKYGEWAGDPYAQWCAEFLCWCVDQVDQQHGTNLLKNVYPLYSGQNTGRSWFITKGRYIVRWGNLEDWGYQWMQGDDSYITTGTYIPQPGDWVFFTWTDDQNTDHVAMVEYCTRDKEGNVNVHVIEGNTPVAVKRTVYPLTYTRILGYGTVHDVAETTMRYGNVGEKVQQLQNKLVYLGYLDADKATGTFGNATVDAVKAFQHAEGLKEHGVANKTMQDMLNKRYLAAVDADPATWQVVDDND